MLDQLPERVDAYELATARRSVRGTLPVSRMGRLSPLLASTQGEVSIELAFGVDEERTIFVVGRLTTTLRLYCQRCLEPLDVPLAAEVSLGVVRSDALARRLPGRYEPLVSNEETISLLELVEDELLLALPQAPMHAASDCAVQLSAVNRSDTVAKGESPFAVLASLKKQ